MTEKDHQDSLAEFEEALERMADQKFVLKLYVSGATGRSSRAIENIRGFCEEHLKGRYELEVIDIYQHPELLEKEQVIAAPTLIKQLPPPLRKLIGDMSDEEKILVGLDIRPPEESTEKE
ncbi:MAG: circadian clock KaiB family protein [Desulfobacteraceae bacterium]|nr:circadian clock KaiB family protein [Desulfobacteraceae bacterium]